MQKWVKCFNRFEKQAKRFGLYLELITGIDSVDDTALWILGNRITSFG